MQGDSRGAAASPAAVAGRALTGAWVFFALALPLSVAGGNIGWGLVAAALAAQAILARRGLTPAPRLAEGLTPLALPAALYVAAAFAAGWFGTEPAHSLSYLHKDAHKLWLCLLLPAGLAALERPAHIWVLAGAGAGFTLAAGAGMALYAAASAADTPRSYGLFHAVTFGELMAMGASGAAAFTACPPQVGRWARPLAAGVLAASCGALFLNETRSAILGLGAAVVAASRASPALRRLAPWLLVSILAACLLADLRKDRSLIAELTALARGAAAPSPQLDRLALWRAAGSMFRERPLTGVGPNQFRAHFPRHAPPVDPRTSSLTVARSIGSAHNLFLHQAAERGLAGLAALAALFWTLWSRAWQRARERPDGWNLWALGATAAFTVMNMTEAALEVEQVWMLYFFIWLWAEKRHSAPPAQEPARQAQR